MISTSRWRVNSSLPLTYENKEELWKVESPSNDFLVINSGPTGPEWMKDVRVRRALALAIDKEAMVTAVGDPSDHVPLDGYVPNGLKGAEKDFRTESDEKEKFLQYDPEEARRLLKEAGYDETNPLKRSLIEHSARPRCMLTLRPFCRECGKRSALNVIWKLLNPAFITIRSSTATLKLPVMVLQPADDPSAVSDVCGQRRSSRHRRWMIRNMTR